MSAWSNSTLPMIATFGQVVDELRPLVEEGGVVLVALDHEVPAARQPVAAPEVHRHAADQERRVEPGPVQQEGEQARGRRLAVRPRDHERRPGPEELLGEERGQAREALAPVEHRLHLGVASRERVADHHEVGVRGHVRLGPRREDRDAQRLELRRHRRVDVLVGARHLVALLAQEPGERRHGRPADGRQVDLHSTGASRMAKEASSPRHSSRARTPNGSVTLGWAVWPLERPRATGTSKPSRASMRISSSR